ncbi:hypothetical protein B0H13DRAFT_1511581, partial [Mycena leptocephala]
LPPEILALIFIQCLPDHVFPSLSTAPLLLCGICHRWREVVLSTPNLWSSISLYFAAVFDWE